MRYADSRKVQIIEYKHFKDKINITKKFDGQAQMKVYKGYVYLEFRGLS